MGRWGRWGSKWEGLKGKIEKGQVRKDWKVGMYTKRMGK